jgi:hypothetical protein
MAFVRLHRNEEPVFVNTDRVAYCEAVESVAQDGTKHEASKLCFDNDLSIVVDEPLDQLRHRFI